MLEWLSRRSHALPRDDARRTGRLHADALTRATQGPAPAIEALVIPTAGRPELLRRCLAGHVAAIVDAGRTCELVVCDDSPEGVADEVEAASLSQRLPGGVRYIGIAARRAMAKRLTAAGARPELVDFALFGNRAIGRGAGANRNAALLATAGRVTVSTDDDIVARVAPIPGATGGLSLLGGGDASEIWFHRDRQAALTSVRFADVDPLALHEELLGRKVDDLVAAHAIDPRELEIAHVSPNDLRRLSDGRAAVRSTQLGIVGDSGMTWPAALWVSGGNTRERLQASFETHGITREVVRGVQKLSISRTRKLMAYHVGLDARQLLPPFFPALRNSDGCFAQTLQRCDVTSCTGLIPWAIEHDPSEARPIDPLELERAFDRPRFSLLLVHAMAGWQPPLTSSDPAERMRSLGRHLAAVGELAVTDFEERLRVERLRQRAGVIARLQDGRSNATSLAIETIYSRAIGIAERGLRGPLAVVPVDLPGQTDATAALLLVRAAIARYGELLEIWPDLFAEAAAG